MKPRCRRLQPKPTFRRCESRCRRCELSGSLDLGELKAEFGELKAELHAREARLIKWVAGLVVAGAAAAAGVAIAVNQVLAAGVGG